MWPFVPGFSHSAWCFPGLSPCCSPCQCFTPFHGWVPSPRVDGPHCVCPAPTDGPLGCFHLLAILNSAAVDIGVQVSIWVPVQISRYIPKSGMTRSYGNPAIDFLRNGHTVFCSGCTILHSYQQCTRVLISSHPHLYLLVSVVLTVAILMGVMQYLTLDLIGVSLVTGDWTPFHGLLTICEPPLEKCLSSSLPIFNLALSFSFFNLIFIVFFPTPLSSPLPPSPVFLMLSYRSSLYILHINSLSATWFTDIFSHSMSSFF